MGWISGVSGTIDAGRGGVGCLPLWRFGTVGDDMQKVSLCVFMLMLREYGSIAWRSSLGIMGCRSWGGVCVVGIDGSIYARCCDICARLRLDSSKPMSLISVSAIGLNDGASALSAWGILELGREGVDWFISGWVHVLIEYAGNLEDVFSTCLLPSCVGFQ